jgi:hypothetical protein
VICVVAQPTQFKFADRFERATRSASDAMVVETKLLSFASTFGVFMGPFAWSHWNLQVFWSMGATMVMHLSRGLSFAAVGAALLVCSARHAGTAIVLDDGRLVVGRNRRTHSTR